MPTEPKDAVPTAQGERDPRVYFAGERTMLAWVRTGIAMMGFGFVIARFGLFMREVAAVRPVEHSAQSPGMSLWVGAALIIMGVWLNIAAAARHHRFRDAFERGQPFITPRNHMMMVLVTLLTALGLGMTIYLLRLG